MANEQINTWEYDPKPLLLSPRKVTGTFHKSKVDKDGELITPDAIRKSIPDYMHLPALHDFHKERPVGLATKIWELKDGEFGFEGVIKATADCDDVWEKISKGSYDHLSIFGKREQHNSQCDIPQQMRTGPCITTGVRLDSISVCDMNARNDQTSLEVKKARMVFDAEKLIKAETAGSSNLMHTPTDYAGKKKLIRLKKEFADLDTEQEGAGDYDAEETKQKRASTEKKCGGCSGKDVISKPKKYRVVEKCNDTEEKAIVRVPLTKRPERQKVRFTQMRPPQVGEKKVEKGDRRDYGDVSENEPDEDEETTWRRKAEQDVEKGIVRVPLKKRPEDTDPRGRRERPDEWIKREGRQNPETFKNKPHPSKRASGSKGTTPSFPDKGTDVPPPKERHPVSCRNCSHRVRQKTGSTGVNQHENICGQGGGKANPQGKKFCTQHTPVPKKVKKADEEDVEEKAIHQKTENETTGKDYSTRETRRNYRQYLKDEKEHGGKSARDKLWRREKSRSDINKAEVDHEMNQDEDIEKSDDMPDDEQQEEQIEKGSMVTPSGDLEDQYDEEDDSSKKKIKRTDKEGRWSKKGEPNGTVKMTKAKDRMDYGDVEDDEDEDDSEGEADDESEEKDVEKGASDRIPYESGGKTHTAHGGAKESLKSGSKQLVARQSSDIARRRATQQERSSTEKIRDGIETPNRYSGTWQAHRDSQATVGMRNLHKGTVKKGDNMADEKHAEEGENVQEYVTKAMVPIEEVDTIVKARTEEITKAYTVQIDELRKAHADLKSQVEKMEKETIRKGGSIVVIPQLLDPENKGMLSNADAVARMQAGRT